MKRLALKEHGRFAVILALYFIMAGFTGWQEPLTEGPDEAAHFMYARFLKQEGRLPLTPAERSAAGYKSDQPPLYGAAVATLYWRDDLDQPPFARLTRGVPRRHLVSDAGIDEDDVNSPQLIRTEDPLRGELLFWYFGRWLAILFGGLTLVVVYGLALQVFAGWPQRPGWALAAVGSVAFIPSFVFISAVFNYESLLGLWLALYMLTAVYLLRRSEPAWLYLLAGLFIGLALVTKLSALPAPLGLCGLVLAAGYRAGWPVSKYLTRLAWSAGGLLIGAGWWFGFIIFRLNRVAELGWLAGLIQPIIAGDGSDSAASKIIGLLSGQAGVDSAGLPSFAETGAWLAYLFRTFWSFQWRGWETIQFLLIGVSLFIIVGLVQIWRTRPDMRLWLAFCLFHLSLFLILPAIRFFITGDIMVAGQGHHILFPALGAVAVLTASGLGAWSLKGLPRFAWLGGALLGGALLGWGAAALFGPLARPALPALPVRTVPPLMPVTATNLALDFGPMKLLGFELKGLSDAVCCETLGINLYWQAEELAPKDYQTVVNLLDNQGIAHTIWAGYPDNGRYPNRAWEPGDVIRDELWLPLVGLKSGVYTVTLEVREAASAVLVNGRASFQLAQVEIAQPPTLTGPAAFHLWQQGQVAGDRPVFGSRATIQITTAGPAGLKLIGPDQVEQAPALSAGRTHIFIVDPLWVSGPYQLQVVAGGVSSRSPEPVLEIRMLRRQKDRPPSQFTINANFANQLMLLGYNLPRRHLQVGEPLPVTLHWQALQVMPTDFIMFSRVRDQAGQVWGGHDRWPKEHYSPLLWAAGEVVEDGFAVVIAPDAPAGLYYLDVGWYLPVGQTAVSLPLVQDGHMSDMTGVTLGPFEVGDVSLPGILTETPHPQTPLNQPFGNTPQLILLGYDLADQTGQPLTNYRLPVTDLHLTLYWQVTASLLLDYTTFVHIRDETGQMVAQKDRPPLNGAYPTSLWEPGEIIADEIVIPLTGPLPAQTYQVVVGLYNLETGQRLPTPNNPANEIQLATVAIP